MRVVTRTCWAACLLIAPAIAAAQAIDSGSIFRIFLKDGSALPSYGDYAVVGDRLIFTLAVGHQTSQLQLMSLPTAAVDLERTAKYATSVRAAHYARTRGEADYTAMTGEVTEALDHLAKIDDPAKRLALAEEAKRRLLAWSRENYSYRASNIRELAGLFDEVIAELRIAAGESGFSLEFSTGPVVPVLESLWPAPAYPESIFLAFAAARAADLPEERAAILRAALATLGDDPEYSEMRAALTKEIEEERAADAAYATLASDLIGRADRAMRRADVRAVTALTAELEKRDEALQRRRAPMVNDLAARLRVMADKTVAYRLALDHYALVRRRLMRYERRVRPVMSGVDSLKPVLTAIQDLSGVAYARLEQAEQRLARFRALLLAVPPPQDVAAVHATLSSALRMAEQACARRKTAVATTSLPAAKEAAAAASGALLLAGQARQDLVAMLFPPKLDPGR